MHDAGTSWTHAASPLTGFCGVTEEAAPNRCGQDRSGAWPLSTLHECVLACSACRNCAFLSFSSKNRDCSWYSSCERLGSAGGLSPLHQQLSRSYVTLNASLIEGLARVAPAAECRRRMDTVLAQPERARLADAATIRQQASASAPASATGPIRFAIATMLYSSRHSQWSGGASAAARGSCAGYRCGLVGWCASARRLKSVLPSHWAVDLVTLVLDGEERNGGGDGGGGGGGEATTPPRGSPTGAAPEPLCDERALARQHCPGVRVVGAERRLLSAIASHAAHGRRRVWHPLTRAHAPAVTTAAFLRLSLAKWHFFGMTEYDAVLFADLDIDVMPAHTPDRAARAPAVAKEWASALPALLRRRRNGGGGGGIGGKGGGGGATGGNGGGAGGVGGGGGSSVRAIVNPDPKSAINGGMLLVLPDAALYRDGVRVMRAGFHGPVEGWNRTGTPAALLASRTLRHRSGGVVAYGGAPARVDNAYWDFVGADIDQGFLVYMLLARHAGAARFADRSGAHQVEHFFGPGEKPWVRTLDEQLWCFGGGGFRCGDASGERDEQRAERAGGWQQMGERGERLPPATRHHHRGAHGRAPRQWWAPFGVCPLFQYLQRMPLATNRSREGRGAGGAGGKGGAGRTGGGGGAAVVAAEDGALASSPCVREMRQARRRMAAAMLEAARRAELPPFPRCAAMCDEDVDPVASFWGFWPL